jgi:hypothetical protein
MKNKKMIYLLGLVVVIVWGIIIYRIIEAAVGSDDTVLPNSTKVVKELYNDYTTTKDTSHLLLNYRDPFGLKKQADTTQYIAKRSHRAQVFKPVINWSFIKYSGYIRNPGTKKIIAILSINGKNVMLTEGETSGNVKLLKNMRDSVKINFNGNVKFISMNPRTI